MKKRRKNKNYDDFELNIEELIGVAMSDEFKKKLLEDDYEPKTATEENDIELPF